MSRKSPRDIYYSALKAELPEPEMEQTHFGALSLALQNAWSDSRPSFSHPLEKFCFDNGVRSRLVKEVMEKARPLVIESYNTQEVGFQQALLGIGKSNLACLPRFTEGEALTLVLDAFAQFHPEVGKLARDIVEQERIDLSPTLAGPSCYCEVPSGRNPEHPLKADKVKPQDRSLSFVSPSLRFSRVHSKKLSFDDIITLAHEIAHGIAIDMAHHNGTKQSKSIPMDETLAALGERLVVQVLLARTQHPYQRFLIARKYCSHINNDLSCGQLTKLQHELLNASRVASDLPDIAEAKAISKKVYGEDSVQRWRYPHFVAQEAYYVSSYVLGNVAAQAFFDRWRNGDTEIREKMAGDLVKVMKDGSKRGYAAIPYNLGLNVNSPDYLEKGIESLRYYDKLACEAFKESQKTLTIQKEDWHIPKPSLRRGKARSADKAERGLS